MKNVDVDEPTAILDHVYLGCTHRECKANEITTEENTKMFESRISAGSRGRSLCCDACRDPRDVRRRRHVRGDPGRIVSFLLLGRTTASRDGVNCRRRFVLQGIRRAHPMRILSVTMNMPAMYAAIQAESFLFAFGTHHGQS